MRVVVLVHKTIVTKPCYWCWWDCYLSLIKELMWNPAGWYQNKLFHPREKFCKNTWALMSDEKERGELLVMRNSVWREERRGEDPLINWARLGRLDTAQLWAHFTNGDYIIISLGSKGRTIIYSLSPNWMLETWNPLC